MKSDQEHRFTSTGVKFWQHPEQMDSYRQGTGRTVVSTHIAPEGACNLKCPYCSVTHRDTHNRIDLDVVLDYVDKLKSRGLKAVILTGGGEPTAYKHFNELVWELKGRKLDVALITNGTLTDRVDKSIWKKLSWVRVSVNFFPGWEDKIRLPTQYLHGVTVGCSVVYTEKHEEDPGDWKKRFEAISGIATRCGAEYIRVLPNCLLPQPELAAAHKALDFQLESVGDSRFFRQDKHHRAPGCGTCHQAYFRPYLSEECMEGSDKPGSVYPCDSVVLNDAVAKFTGTYQLCAPWDILDFLDGKIGQQFDPRKDCTGCVFTDNVEMLDRWKQDGRVPELPEIEGLNHGNFV